MKLQLKCDACGEVGTPEQIETDYDDRDLCKACARKQKVEEIERDIKAAKGSMLKTAQLIEIYEKCLAEIKAFPHK